MPVIGISGSYGGLNVGDEAILACALQELRAAAPGARIVVFSRNAKHTEAHQDADRVVAVRQIGREEAVAEVRKLDLLLLGGGGILYDKEATVYLREVQIAQELGVKTATFAVSAGPLDTPDARRAVASTLNRMDLVTVREPLAKRLLEEIGVRHEVQVTADPALLLTPEPFTRAMLEAEGIRTERHLVAISVREPGPAAPDLEEIGYHGLIANAADFVADRLDADLLFVPMERADIRHSHAVIARMAHAERAWVLKGEYGPRQILGLMEHLDMVVGMRLHILIFSAIARVPFVPLPYAGKVAGFLEALGLPATTLQEEHVGPLLASIDRSWDWRHKLKEAMDQRMPALQERARETARLAGRLVADEEPAEPPAAEAPGERGVPAAAP
jgi:polysaccharide pyruvyl transferase CsaB